MSAQEANPPAFPVELGWGLEAGEPSQTGERTAQFPGMLLRDWFAGQALNGLLASGKWDNCGVGFGAYIAGHAGNIADAMLAARSTQGDKQ